MWLLELSYCRVLTCVFWCALSLRSKVASNLLARGVDVKNLTLVVNYEVPLLRDGQPDPESYLHRIGRTGLKTIQFSVFLYSYNGIFFLLKNIYDEEQFL